MSKKLKLIVGITLGVIIVGMGLAYGLAKLGYISLGIFADQISGGKYSYTVTTDSNKGEVFQQSASQEAFGIKLSAIPRNTNYQFSKWTSSSPSCKFLDETKAVTAASIKANCKITAEFTTVLPTGDFAGYEEICQPADFDKIRNNLAGKFIQTCDIDMSGINFEPIGEIKRVREDWPVVEQLIPKLYNVFQGVYEGNGKVINNLSINYDKENAAMFRGNTGIIRNITLSHVNIKGAALNTAGLVGINQGDNSLIENVIVTGELSDSPQTAHNINKLAGVVAITNGGRINKAVANVKLTQAAGQTDGDTEYPIFVYQQKVGGILGKLAWGELSNSYVVGQINNFQISGGGAVGQMGMGVLTGCSANVSVVDNKSIDSVALGGLIGELSPGQNNEATIFDSFALGDIEGHSYVGGLIGTITGWGEKKVNIINSYSYGNQIKGGGMGIGGLIGNATNLLNGVTTTTFKNCSAHTNISLGEKARSIGGLVGQTISREKFDFCRAVSQIDMPKKNPVRGGKHIGGFIGSASGSIVDNSSSYSVINAPESTIVGGFLGAAYGSLVSNSYARGSILATSASGFIDAWGEGVHLDEDNNDTTPSAENTGVGNWPSAEGADVSLVNNYSSVKLKTYTTEGSPLGGFIRSYYPSNYKVYLKGNYYNKSIAGTDFSLYSAPRTTVEMRKQATYVGWDFAKDWVLNPEKNGGFPGLRKKY